MRHAQYRHRPSPFMILAFGMLLFWLFGFKLFFFLPLFFLLGVFGMRHGCGMGYYDDGHDWTSEKPKRKRKNDDYYVEDDDDVTYI